MSIKSLRDIAARVADEASTMPFGEDRAKRYAYALGLLHAATCVETGVLPEPPNGQRGPRLAVVRDRSGDC